MSSRANWGGEDGAGDDDDGGRAYMLDSDSGSDDDSGSDGDSDGGSGSDGDSDGGSGSDRSGSYDSASSESIEEEDEDEDEDEDDEEARKSAMRSLKPGVLKQIIDLPNQLGKALREVQDGIKGGAHIGRAARLVERAAEVSNDVTAALTDLQSACKEVGPKRLARIWAEIAKRSTDPHFARTPREFTERLARAFKSAVSLPSTLFKLGSSERSDGAPHQSRVNRRSMPAVLDACEQAIAAWATEVTPQARRVARGLRAKSRRDMYRDVHSGVSNMMRSVKDIQERVDKATDEVWDSAQPEMPAEPKEGWLAWIMNWKNWAWLVGKIVLTVVIVLVGVVCIALIIGAFVALILAIGGPITRMVFPSLYSGAAAVPFLGPLFTKLLQYFVPDKMTKDWWEGIGIESKEKYDSLVEGSWFGMPKKWLYHFFPDDDSLKQYAANAATDVFLDPSYEQIEAQGKAAGVFGLLKGTFWPTIASLVSGDTWTGTGSAFFNNLDPTGAVNAQVAHKQWVLRLFWYWLEWSLKILVPAGTLAFRSVWWVLKTVWKLAVRVWTQGEKPKVREARRVISAEAVAAAA